MPTPQPNLVPYILWGAMGSSQAILLFIGASQPHVPVPDAVLTAQILVVPAMIAAVVSAVLGLGAVVPALDVIPRAIVRWALAESAALLGLVALQLSGAPLYQYVCAAFGFVAWAYAFPRNAEGWPIPPRRLR